MSSSDNIASCELMLENGDIIQSFSNLRPTNLFEQSSISVKTRGVEDGVLPSVELGYFVLQVLVYVLSAANEPDGGHSGTVRPESLDGSLDHLGVAGQSEVVVGTEVQYRPLRPRHLHRDVLHRGDDSLGLPGPGLAHSPHVVKQRTPPPLERRPPPLERTSPPLQRTPPPL